MIACYIEGFKDGRTLMLAADHAARLRKPIVMVKVGRTAAGQSMAASHTGHLTGSDAVTSAVFRQFGVTRVDGLDELLEVSAVVRTHAARTALPAWAKKQRQPGVCVYAISGGTGAHMADMVAAAGLRVPDLTKKSQQQLHDGLIPAYLRVSNPVDCGGPPVADARGRKILDVILADDNVDIVVIPITGAVAMFSRAVHARHHRRVAQTTDEADLRRVGRAGRHRRHVLQAPARRRPAGVPHVRQLRRGGARRTRTTGRSRRGTARRSTTRPTTPSPAAKKARALLAGLEPGEALSEWQSKQLLQGVRHQVVEGRACAARPRPRCSAANAIGFPVVMKVVVARPAAQERRRARARSASAPPRRCAPPTTSCSPRRSSADRKARHRGRARVRDGDAAASRRSSASRRTSCSARSSRSGSAASSSRCSAT